MNNFSLKSFDPIEPSSPNEQVYLDKIDEIRKEMETALKQFYNIEVRRHNTISPICKLVTDTKNMRIQVYIDDEYRDYSQLLGIYENTEALNEKIRQLTINDLFIETKVFDSEEPLYKHLFGKLIGKCKNCNSYINNVPGSHLKIYHDLTNVKDVFYDCGITSKWSQVNICKTNESIWIPNGQLGCLGVIMKTIGRYKFLVD